MYKLYGGIVGSRLQNTELKYFDQYTADTEENYLKNFSKNPEKLIYFDSVTHKFNNTGHRCKNIDEIDLNNYVLCIGCSQTFGLGNYIEDTYPYMLSKALNMDYYNLGLVGSGTDTHLHNLLIWCNTMPMPKFIVWQWTSDARVICMRGENFIYGANPWANNDDINHMLTLADSLGFFKIRRKLATEILKIIDTPIIQIDISLNKESIHFDCLDFSRDMRHLGPKSHTNVSQCIYNYYLNKYSNNHAIN